MKPAGEENINTRQDCLFYNQLIFLLFHIPLDLASKRLACSHRASTKAGTWNISEHSGTSRNRANYHKINEKKKRKKDFNRKRLKKQPKNKRTNKQTKFKIRCNGSTFPPILSFDFLPCWFLTLFLASP